MRTVRRGASCLFCFPHLSSLKCGVFILLVPHPNGRPYLLLVQLILCMILLVVLVHSARCPAHLRSLLLFVLFILDLANCCFVVCVFLCWLSAAIQVLVCLLWRSQCSHIYAKCLYSVTGHAITLFQNTFITIS